MQQEDDMKWAKWLSGNLPKEESDDLSQSEDGKQLQSFLQSVDKLEMPKLDEEQAWESFVSKSGFPMKEEDVRPPTKVVSARRWLWAVAAGVLLLAVGAWVFSLLGSTTVSTLYVEKAEHTLPDQSVITLNSDSRITYQTRGWEENRLIELSGEAYFEVEEGSTFRVKTEMGEVTVLGTSFNVRNRNQKLEVFCYTGKVRVSGAGNQSTLTPGEGVVVIQDEMKTMEDTATKPSWTRGTSTFKNTPVYEVLEEIERQFDVKIVHENPDTLYNGGFPHEKSIEEALNIVIQSIPTLTYKETGPNTYRVYKK